ncbi:MAG: rod shape-determining protein [Ruminococcaceae bacterium]|nr:rod shape-determining protein [Oscillospiraceae bacterium]
MSLIRSYDIAIDFGTSTTQVHIKGKGVTYNQPSCIALSKETGKVVAIGTRAKNMIGKVNDKITIIQPVKNGTIENIEAARLLMKHILDSIGFGTIKGSVVMLSIPCTHTEIEKRCLIDMVLHAGARKAYIIKKPVAVAIGNGINVSNPSAWMIVTIGAGICEAAVVTLGTTPVFSTIKTGTDDLDFKIMKYVKEKHGLLIGKNTAEKAKMEVGNVFSLESEMSAEISGRSLHTALPSKETITGEEMKDLFKESVDEIINMIKDLISDTPPELMQDIRQNGIILDGGGANLKGLGELIVYETGLKVTKSQEPELSTVMGTAKALNQLKILIKTGIV